MLIAVADLCFVVVISEILNREEHELENRRLTVAPFYECLGPLPPGMGIEPCWTPPAITVDFDSRIVQFVVQTDAVRSHVENSLNDLYPGCTVTWPHSASCDSGLVKISFDGVKCGVSSTTVSKASRDRLTELLGMMEAGSVDVLQEIWPHFVEQWEQHSAEVDTSICVELDQKNCCVHVVGECQKCSEMIVRLRHLQKELVNELERSKMRISETMKTISPFQVSLLKTCGLLETDSAEELTATVVDNVVVLEGQPEKVAEQKMRMYEMLASACSEKVRVDEYVLTVLKAEPFRHHVDQLLQHITGVVWCMAGKEIEVYGKDKNKVSRPVFI